MRGHFLRITRLLLDARRLLGAPHALGAAFTCGAALALSTPLTLGAQGALDEYVQLGLRQNLSMRQQALSVAQSEALVREVRGNFFPSATFNARHTNVSGQVVNLGELINPAFGALNQLLGQPSFPTDIDLRLPLRQETSVRVAQPIVQVEIFSGYRAATAARDAQEASFGAAERALAADIRSAYINHAKARRLAELRAATREVIEEQVRVMSALISAGRATPDALSRARAELSEAEQREAEAAQLVEASAQSFNLMVGRNLTDSVAMVDEAALGLSALPSLESALAMGRDGREELRALESYRRAADAQRRAAQGSYIPNVALAVDYGIQGNEYRFARDADFTLVSVVASWNLFNGGKDQARVQQARLETERYALQGEDARRGVELQVRMAWQAAAVARTAIETAEAQLEAADRTWQLVRRRAEEGLAPPIELSEARVARTAAQLNAVLTTYDYYLRRVELDRAAALYPRNSK
jgi:outer membrane protein TolC